MSNILMRLRISCKTGNHSFSPWEDNFRYRYLSTQPYVLRLTALKIDKVYWPAHAFSPNDDRSQIFFGFLMKTKSALALVLLDPPSISCRFFRVLAVLYRETCFTLSFIKHWWVFFSSLNFHWASGWFEFYSWSLYWFL